MEEETMEEKNWERVPEDVWIRIWAFLPTFIVVRLRSVCRRWNLLISSAQTFPPNVPLSSTPAFLICWSHWLTSHPELLLIGGSYDCVVTSHLSRLSLHFLPPQPKSIKIVAACRSLLCCSYDGEPTMFCICNPASRTWLHLPRPHQLTSWDFIALAFDPSATRCKLVIGRKRMVQQGQFNTVLEIYDSHTNSWADLQMTTRQSVNPQGEGIYSKGGFYWISVTHMGVVGNRYDVVRFNVEDARWHTISHPHAPCYRRRQLQFWELSGHDGRVVLIYKNDLSFWKLNEDEDGKPSKWSALPVRCFSDGTDEDLSSHACVQVVANCSGLMLVYFPNKKMVVLDEEGRLVRKIQGKELSTLGASVRCPTSVRSFEANNVWWPC